MPPMDAEAPPLLDVPPPLPPAFEVPPLLAPAELDPPAFLVPPDEEPPPLPPSEVELDPHRLIEEMHVLTPDRRRAFAGYRAFRWIAWRLPLTWLVAPFLYLPGVPWLGNRVYRWVARNRFNLVPCDDGGCQVPLKK